MKKQTKDFLIRNMPLDLHKLLECEASKHYRSKTQEAIFVLTTRLKYDPYLIKKPKPLKWKKKLTRGYIKGAIEEGRE